MSTSGESAQKTEEDNEEETFSVVSERNITENEKHFLEHRPASLSCNGGNTHIWKLESGSKDLCSTFSQYQVKCVAIGGEHFLILTEDKKLFTFGSNSHGQLGQGDCEERTELCFINQLQDNVITVISCGERHNVVVDDTGAIYTWGDSRQGQCGLGAEGIFTTPSKVHFPQIRKLISNTSIPMEAFETKIKDISCGELFTVAIDTKGCVWSWGMGSALGHGKDFDTCVSPKLINRLSHKRAMTLACGSYHCVIITQDDYIDSPFQVPSSPDYRTSSVSSNYYSDLKTKGSASSSRIPFLQSKVTNVETSSLSSLKLSQSDSDLSKTTIDNSLQNISMSSKEIGSLKTSHNKLSFDESSLPNSSLGADSLASSQYYSAVDIKYTSSPESLDNHEKIDTENPTRNTDSPNSQSSTEIMYAGSHSSNETIEAVSNETIDNDITIIEEETLENIEEPSSKKPEGLFQGKKSLFEDTIGNGFENPILRTRSSAVSRGSRKTLPKLNSEVSLDDSIGGSIFDSCTSTQVWSFGKNSYGQLGHGDLEDRLTPVLVKKLNNKGIVKVAAGSYHSLILSSQGIVYSCGDNAFGQLGHMKTIISAPKKIKVLETIRVWDFAAGRNFSIFLGDTERNKTDVFFSGESQRTERRMSNPVLEISHVDRKRQSGKWKLFKRNSESNCSPNLIDIQVRKLTHFHKNEIIKCVIASDYTMACLSQGFSIERSFDPIYKFARAERLIYQQLMTIQKSVIEPFIKTDNWANITKMVGGEALLLLVDSFVDLLNGISTEVLHLTDIICLSLPVQDLFSYIFADSFRGVYERYAKCYMDALAVGHLQTCTKPCSLITSRKKELMKILEKELSLTQATFESLLKVPLVRAHVYCDLAKRISSHCKGPTESLQLKEVISRWLNFSESCTTRLACANATNKFWNESHAKLIDALKDPQRRVLKSSKNDPLTLARASRLSSHSYILCNDVFVHVQYNRNFQVFPLVTLWADAEADTDYLHNAIKITSPEESFVLVAGTSDGKLAWLKELNQAIATCLAACSRLSLDNASVNAKSGLLKAAVAREATYTYLNHLTYKSAVYKGMWMAGEPHGRGKMSWEDDTWYEGEFVKGRFEGFGQMNCPKNVNNTVEKVYEGEWKEGKMCGYGKMSYGLNEEYIGHFKDNARHGHGTLKCSSSKNSLDTVYVGDWVNDVKSGYGVLDYIIRGEKYMGMWVSDQRQGFGVVVTVDGVYYEGRFYQNRLAGQGILLSEDDTCYEGEFTADMLLSGKGVLTLPNGDYMEGSFYGNWGESIKVNGIFSKFSNPLKTTMISNSASEDRLRSTDFTIDADAKWKSLFDECYFQFGCDEDTFEIEAEAAWKNVNDSVIQAAGSMSGMYRNPTARMDLNFIRNCDFKEQMSLAGNLKDLQEFLVQTFDMHGHPLHTLVEGLSEVYRATYVGVGAHRRLLPHAVAEAKSYVARLFNVLRILFPDLHDEDFVMLSNDTVDGYVDPPINSMSLLHPLLLPRLYPPLFTLYALQTEKTDALYTEKLHYLNKRGDMALLSFLGLKRDFWLLPDEEFLSDDKEKSHKVYTEPIEMLGEISTTYSPMGKIEVLRNTFNKIHEEINEHFKGVRKVLAMDDLFPLFQFIVIRARIPHLGSEIQFIEDLVEYSVLVGEAGHMVTTLSACYFQIQQERDRDI